MTHDEWDRWTDPVGIEEWTARPRGMTQPEWQACTNPARMLGFLGDPPPEHGLGDPWVNGKNVSDRKLRLFACACVRRVWHLLTDAGRAAVEVAERFADGEAAQEELFRVGEVCKWIGRNATTCDWAGPTTPAHWAAECTCGQSAWDAAITVDSAACAATPGRTRETALEADPAHFAVQADLLRDIITPFRDARVEPWWLTSAVTALARGVYESRDFSPMPVLADALEDADCADPDILAHCRGGGPHVRGCWVVDLVLGKA